jgi:hypothetical protein
MDKLQSFHNFLTTCAGSPPDIGRHEAISTDRHPGLHHWFDTTITLPADTNPKQLHAAIKSSPAPQTNSIGKVVIAIFKIEFGMLTLVTTGGGPEEAAKNFEPTDDRAVTRYELRKVQPQKQNSQAPKWELMTDDLFRVRSTQSNSGPRVTPSLGK